MDIRMAPKFFQIIDNNKIVGRPWIPDTRIEVCYRHSILLATKGENVIMEIEDKDDYYFPHCEKCNEEAE